MIVHPDLSERRSALSAIICSCLILFLAANATESEGQTASVMVVPASMTTTGDVAMGAAVADRCDVIDADLLPPGAIAVGAKADDCNPGHWEGGTTSIKLHLQDVYSPTVYALRINMDDSGYYVEGIIDQTRHVSILLDGREICRLRLGMSEETGEYWIPIHSSFVTSIVIRQSKSYELTFRVPPEAMWVIRKLELVAYSYPDAVRGIGYSPYHDCQFPGGEYRPSIPTEQQIREDMFMLSHTCNAIRTYGATGVNSLIPRIATEDGLQTFAGAWIDTSDEKNHQEIEALIEIANNCDIEGVIIGNEYLHRRLGEIGGHPDHYSIMDQKASYLTDFIRRAKAGIHRDKVKFAIAEIGSHLYDKNTDSINGWFQQILDELDIVMVHFYPFWDGQAISGAAELAIQDYEKVRYLFEAQGKRVIIGETGWPSAGKRHSGNHPSDTAAAASLSSQRRYLTRFLSLAADSGAEYMYFDAFDELWKIEEGTVGQNWGYCFSDRSNKHYFNGVLLPQVEYAIPRGRWIVETDRRSEDQTFDRFVVYDEWPPIPRPESKQTDRAEYAESAASPKSDGADPRNLNVFIPSGFLGNYEAVSLNQCDRTDPQSGEMAARIDIDFDGSPSWAGVQWLANREWTGPGIDMYKLLEVPERSRVSLKFWAKGLRGDERVKFGVGGNYGSLGKDEEDWTTLNTTWTPYSFSFSAEDDLSNVIGGLFVITDLIHNRGRSVTIFLDDIYFEAAP